MNKLALRGLLILVGAFVLCFIVFKVMGPPMAEGGKRIESTFFATVAAGTYALTSLAAVVFSRAVLGLFIDFNRPVTFFRVLGSITDPFMALFDPVTPGFIEPALKPFYTAFCLYFIKMMLFGVGAAPPPWVFLLLALG
jgi:uncharacterized protein YggT (Ycf19 family)